MKNLKVYAGNTHPHEAQAPVVVDFASLSTKNKKA
jgi:large subunit ribosomal protein L13